MSKMIVRTTAARESREVTVSALGAIPVMDVRDGGPLQAARLADDRMHCLFRHARRTFTSPALAFMDGVSRRWLERSNNPYRGEIDEIAALLGKPGAYALNTSYEWACTSGVGTDPEGGVRLMRVLDWRLAGLGRNLIAAWQRGPAGEFINLTWPGYVGVITAAAPGRFAVAINQPPMMRWGATPPIDWLIGRAQVWRSRALPPSHLLRQVCESCTTYKDAKQCLAEMPLCLPAFFILAGTMAGEGCVIERTADRVAIRGMPTAAANHWMTLPERGRARGGRSRERVARMEMAIANGTESWRTAPVLNRSTRLVSTMNPSTGKVCVQGWERHGPATAELALNLGSSAK
jgi:hypothetical protein